MHCGVVVGAAEPEASGPGYALGPGPGELRGNPAASVSTKILFIHGNPDSTTQY
ncbi:hypothetical protein OG946_31660 [Streptomyces sp. NBC_01808]|uniref:hypothetical protein n=1 Tax=Streptomyces sp. NBC_01808 TaxID=2975947 RepID=UPI002DD80435|nr:hypothetical protein [Streptomyces sp. NBC_01808]WSA41541.1 hypothetical protein OG946_31660 [Streptomyces sp. NBC_01808]